MTPALRRAGNAPPDPEDLLTLALSRPQEALNVANEVLGGRPDPCVASYARQARGIVLRDRGDVAEAIRELRVALRLARRCPSPTRVIDVQATLGTALAWSGRSRDGLAVLGAAVGAAHGAAKGRVLMRRAGVLSAVGRHDDALVDLRLAVPLLEGMHDDVWTARALSWRALAHLALGHVQRASMDLRRAEDLFGAAGQELESAFALHNRGLAAFVQGDLPAALRLLGEAGTAYEQLDYIEPDLPIDMCRVYLSAGLASDAEARAEDALARIRPIGGLAYKRVELLLAAATASLGVGNAGEALSRAREARRLARSQGREVWEARAEFLGVLAQHHQGSATPTLLRQAQRQGDRLSSVSAEEAARAQLLAGRLASALGRTSEARELFGAAAKAGRHQAPLTRSLGYLAVALQSEADGRVRTTLSACRHGLDAIDEHRRTLGATELRAHATAHGAELASIAQRVSIRRGDSRGLLRWSERQRGAALALPQRARAGDPELVAALAALRDVTFRLQSERPGVPMTVRNGGGAAVLDRERRQLERLVRERSLQTSGSQTAASMELDLDGLVAELGERRLVELVEVDETLHALTVANGRVRRYEVGAVPGAELEMALFALRQASYALPHVAHVQLEPIAQRLQDALLGAAATHLSGADVVIVPPSNLHAVPWSMLPALRDSRISVAPSSSTWLRAKRSTPPRRKHVALVRGPNLESEGAEVPALARLYPRATVLEHGMATAERVLAALDGAWLAHVAAHGAFRSDNPLFSALEMDDGPLTVHDFERLRRSPYRLILSACESGVSQAVGKDELLGLTSGFMALGSVGVLASLGPVNDEAAVGLMVAVHGSLSNGADLPEALYRAQQVVGDDPVARATAYSFIALGV